MMTTLDWDKAEQHLTKMIAMYAEIGAAGSFGLQFTLLPLFRQFESGERTQVLYDEIMACE